LGATLGSMLDAAEKIDEANHQMLRLALNASVRATHIGAPGAPLNVLSGALQDLAATSRHRSEIVAEALGSMNSAVIELAGVDPVNANGIASGDAVVHQMHTTVDDLHSWSEASFIRIKEITALAARLRDDILAARNALSIQSAICIPRRSIDHAKVSCRLPGKWEPALRTMVRKRQSGS
jgi:hypothetical protein